MTTKSITKCDGCEKTIGYTSYSSEYSLTLISIPKKHAPDSAVYAMQIPSEIEGTKDFCGIKCLKEWIDMTY